jgi:uncharacterized protein YehS (DUF1456 family)
VTNNDVLRSLRFALELDNTTLLECLALAGVQIELAYLAALLKKEDEPGAEPMPDALLARLLDGLITKRRGKREPASSGGMVEPTTAPALTNNRIMRALRIALELQDSDILAILERAGVRVSRTELGALFRREDHRNYQPCGDQFLRNFLKGLASWHRGK